MEHNAWDALECEHCLNIETTHFKTQGKAIFTSALATGILPAKNSVVDLVDGKRNEVGDGIEDEWEMSMTNERASGENEMQIFLPYVFWK